MISPTVRLRPSFLAGLLALLFSAACASTPSLQNAPQDLAAQGYDPVSYFPEGGSKPQKGNPEITATEAGLTYRFATVERRDQFLANPQRYVPAYGGWCAFAMVDGERVDVHPESFLIQNDRLLLFYDGVWGDTRKSWLEADVEDQEQRADAAWQALQDGSGQ